jgi:hypothetical protein
MKITRWTLQRKLYLLVEFHMPFAIKFVYIVFEQTTAFDLANAESKFINSHTGWWQGFERRVSDLIKDKW